MERLYDTTTAQDPDGSAGDSAFDVDKLTFETTVTHGDDSVAGSLDAALSELDSRTATSIIFRIKPRLGDERLRLELNLMRSFFAIRLVISSPDPGWANQALGSVSEEIGKGRPWWAWVHSIWGRILLSEFSAVISAGGFSLLFAPFVGSLWLTVIASALALAAILTINSNRVYTWLFPPVDLVVSGGRSTGSRRFLFLGSLALAVAVGVLVNFIS